MIHDFRRFRLDLETDSLALVKGSGKFPSFEIRRWRFRALSMKLRIAGVDSPILHAIVTSIDAEGSRIGRATNRSANEGWIGLFPTAKYMPRPEATIMAPASS